VRVELAPEVGRKVIGCSGGATGQGTELPRAGAGCLSIVGRLSFDVDGWSQWW